MYHRLSTTCADVLGCNGRQVYIRGTDYHVDSPVRGHGADASLAALDVALMRRTDMNAFRLNRFELSTRSDPLQR